MDTIYCLHLTEQLRIPTELEQNVQYFVTLVGNFIRALAIYRYCHLLVFEYL